MKDLYCKIADWIVSQNIDKSVNSTDIKEISDYVFNVQLKSTGVLKVKECLREKGVTVKDSRFKDGWGVPLNDPRKQNSSSEFKSKFINNGDYSKYRTIDEAVKAMFRTGKLINLYDFSEAIGLSKSEIENYLRKNYSGKYRYVELASKTGNIKAMDSKFRDAKIKDEKYIVYLNGEPYYTAKSYDEAMRIESQLYSASDTEDDFQSYYGSYPDVEIRKVRDSKFKDNKDVISFKIITDPVVYSDDNPKWDKYFTKLYTLNDKYGVKEDKERFGTIYEIDSNKFEAYKKELKRLWVFEADVIENAEEYPEDIIVKGKGLFNVIEDTEENLLNNGYESYGDYVSDKYGKFKLFYELKRYPTDRGYNEQIEHKVAIKVRDSKLKDSPTWVVVKKNTKTNKVVDDKGGSFDDRREASKFASELNRDDVEPGYIWVVERAENIKDSKLTRKQKMWYGEELENMIYPQYLRRNYQKRKARRRKK